ncbi:hypothetical protein SAY87_002147 [Trapa incisa]|uniref:Uncharacterized protein n=1 Tax=Trapa incisa TaxID=236973 RepID=A0AAN7JZ94_9MYRT|nr:hypothetical protein SAY87_002147 [Trapa incisa]
MAEPKEPRHAGSASSEKEKESERDRKGPNLLERAKEEMEAVIRSGKDSSQPHRHHKETHGMSDDINENTPISEVKGPSIFHRVKEEVEALAEAVHAKKHSDDR